MIDDRTDRELLEENNRMLREILGFVRMISSDSYIERQNHEEFLRNVVANIFVETADSATKQKFISTQRPGMKF